MRLFALIITLVVVIISPARAAFLSEGLSYSATRATTSASGVSTQSLNPNALIASGPDFRSGGPLGTFNESLLKFALGSVVSPGSTIVSASLSFTVGLSLTTLGGSDPLTLNVSGFACSSGTVALSDFATSTANVGSAVVPLGIGSGTGTSASPGLPLTFNVTSILQPLLDSGSATVGFQVDNLTPYTWSMISYGTGTAATSQPTLTITYATSSTPAATTPEPGSVTMVGVALALITMWRSATRSRRFKGA